MPPSSNNRMADTSSPAVAAFGSSATPIPAFCTAAAPANWSVENGNNTIGTPLVSASVTLLLPPWVIATAARRKSSTCGRNSRTSQCAGNSPTTERSADPMASATRTSRPPTR